MFNDFIVDGVGASKVYVGEELIWEKGVLYEKYNSVLEYTWKRYNLLISSTIYEEQIGNQYTANHTFSSADEKIMTRYSLNTSTGIFTLSGDGTTAGRVESGMTFYKKRNDTEIEKITLGPPKGYLYYESIKQLIKSVAKHTYVKGTFLDTIKSTNANRYPIDGQSGNYWYDSRTSEYVKGTFIEEIKAKKGTYPENGRHSDGFWYELIE